MSFDSDGQKTLFSREILTPASLAARLQGCFDRDFGQLWVAGEISELSLPHSGHAYFCLKERLRGQEFRLKAVMWKGRRPYAGAALSEGLGVLAKGRLALYAPRGDFQLVVDYLEPRGEGALRLAFEKLKAKLEAEGLFEAGRKRPLPFWPARVAVVSSPSGAAVRDFMRTALARRPGAAISLCPVRVQGQGSAGEIARAIEDLNVWGGFDLIVLTRGGGSLSDLWAFNEEAVVRAVAASRTPTLAAVGHSTDLSLAELAADRRAITPTAAAELVYRDQAAFLEHLAENENRLSRLMHEALIRRRERLADLGRRQARGLIDLYGRRREALTDLGRRLGRFEDRLGLAGQRLDDLGRRLDQALVRRLDGWERRLEILSARLKLLSPHSVLKRGYALVSRDGDERPLTRAGELRIGDRVAVRLADGRFTAKVIQTAPTAE
ncbi:MAG: exodeoxyribonuclease VII large subunit [Candidatus Adiutrix sp.]|jgi:exodeoxyribonuclease VII large subunit|nr:exodeoxyribonuclease VII large subunit [Candidatus Adiutrix sp.]